MEKDSTKLYIIHKRKRIFIHSLAQLKEIQNQTLFKRLKRSVLRTLKLYYEQYTKTLRKWNRLRLNRRNKALRSKL